MYLIIRILGLLLVFGLSSQSVAFSCELNQSESLKSNVARVYVTEYTETVNPDGQISYRYRSGSGTAFFVSDTHLVTSYHVVEPKYVDPEIRITFGEDKITLGIMATATVAAFDVENDIALLEIDPVEGWEVYPFDFAEESIEGEQITAIGYPTRLRGQITVKAGTISSVSDNLADLAQEEGHSGSPIINGSGKVIGVARAVIRTEDGKDLGQTRYVSSGVVADFLKKYLGD